MPTLFIRKIAVLALAVAAAGPAQETQALSINDNQANDGKARDGKSDALRSRDSAAPDKVVQESREPPAEDISGMYSFLQEGEFLQITIDKDAVSGYVSRKGTSESDRGAFLDQFFSKASVSGHDVSFTTKPVHGLWYEFKGRFDRGPAKDKAHEDGYYVLKGTLTESSAGADKKTVSRSREVQFKSYAQPSE